jgi:formylglycine-generating enzyme required for sulfatase activity
MALYLALLQAAGRAALNAVGGGVAGDVVCDVLPEVARKVCDWWGAGRSPDQRRAEVEALAQAPPAEVRQAVAQVVAEVAADQPPAVRERLSIYLSLMPGAVRASLRRPADPAGVHLLGTVDDPESVLPMLPAHLPRFKPGDRPLPGIDWELEELLGAGGFGEVWKARNPHFDAVPAVALKFCLDPGAKDRLLRHEAAVLNQVMRQGRHPGIVALQHTYLSADPPCLEYEYVAGGSLSGLLHDWQRSPPGTQRVTEIMRELAGIIAFAHRLSPPIVHRDLKPANILIAPAPHPPAPSPTEGRGGAGYSLRVADFGIGGVAARQALAATARGVSQGNFLVTALRGAHTPLYASPQQMRGDAPDPRDDVYALGVIWYQLLTGSLTAGRPGGMRWPERLRAAGVSRAQVELLSSCLEDDPADRPADAGVLSEGLKGPPAVSAPVPKAPPRELPKTLLNSVGMRFVLIPAGTFLMGSPPDEPFRGADEMTPRTVTIGRPFYLGVFPVTQRDYEAVMKENPAHFQKKEGGGPDHPVEEVSWDDAMAFCRKLSGLWAEKRVDRVYRLPSEAEWEYACRAGSTTPFSFGARLSSGEANFDGTRPYGGGAAGPFRRQTTPVGSFPANAWGMHDMHGNVWEWCADWHTPGQHRALRGGSWNNSGHLCRSARRQKYAPDFRVDSVGFRVMLEAPG